MLLTLFLLQSTYTTSMKIQYPNALNDRATILDNIRNLQKGSNGFDMRGIIDFEVTSTSNIAAEGPALSLESTFWIGFGFARWLRLEEQNAKNIIVGIGRDSRKSGLLLSDWIAGGLKAGGASVIDVGLCTTPAMYYSCLPSDSYSRGPFHGGISITASHLPSKWNGFKFFTPSMPTNIGSLGASLK